MNATPSFGPDGVDPRLDPNHDEALAQRHVGYVPSILEKTGKYVDSRGRHMDADNYAELCAADAAALAEEMRKGEVGYKGE